MSDQPRIDYTARDFSSIRDALLTYAQDRLPEWTDHSSNDLGVLLVELFSYLGDALFYHQDRIAAESYLATARERRSVVNLLRLIGYELRPALPAAADLVLFFKSDAATTVNIKAGTLFRTTAELTGSPISFQYVQEPLTINPTTLPVLTREQILGAPLSLGGKTVTLDPKNPIIAALLQDPAYKVWSSTLPVVQVDSAVTSDSPEVVGSSDGSGGQRFALVGVPLIDDSLVISVDEGGGPATWTRVDTFVDSLSADPHYIVRRDESDVAWVEFGDGRYGRPPRRGRDNILATYRAGGGVKGNVLAGVISKVVTSIDGLKVVCNATAATGGSDREDTAAAADLGPAQFRASGRAVTEADYESHAKRFGVAKAHAESPLFNLVNLYVAPAGGGTPSDTLVNDLYRYFDTKRLVTMQLQIFGPTYVEVCVDAEVIVDPRFNQTQVRQKAENALRALWSFDAVDFADTLYISQIYEAVDAVDGVKAFNVTTFAKKTVPSPGPASNPGLPPDGRLRFGPHEIPLVTGFRNLSVLKVLSNV